MLSKHAGNVDVCVIAALRRYCMLAPEDVYPCEIRSWPWNAEKVQHWVAEQKKKDVPAGLALAESSARAEPSEARPAKVRETALSKGSAKAEP